MIAGDLLQISSEVGLDEPIFQPFPPQITFYNLEVDQPQEALLYLRNNDKVMAWITKLHTADCCV